MRAPAVFSHLRSGCKRPFQALVSALGSLLRKIPVRRSSWNGLTSADILGEAGSRVPSSMGRGRSSVHRLGGSPSRSYTLSAASRVFTAWSLLSNGCYLSGMANGSRLLAGAITERGPQSCRELCAALRSAGGGAPRSGRKAHPRVLSAGERVRAREGGHTALGGGMTSCCPGMGIRVVAPNWLRG